jgi:Ca2+-binding EF-hand superfamily protein
MKHAPRLIAATAATLLPFAAAFAQTPAPNPKEPTETQQPQQQGTSFESLDVDSDGRISKVEAEANESVKAQFAGYDKNGDGFIERAEVQTANNPKYEAPKQ